MSIGLCVPDKCGIEDIESLLPEFLYLINSIAIPYEFSHIVKKNETNPVLLLEDLKIINSDEKNKKSTYINVVGVDKSLKRSEELAKSAIDEINDEKISNSEMLIELARYITKREK